MMTLDEAVGHATDEEYRHIVSVSGGKDSAAVRRCGLALG